MSCAFTIALKQAVVHDYAQGDLISVIARRHGVSRSAVDKWRKEVGLGRTAGRSPVPRPPRKPWDVVNQRTAVTQLALVEEALSAEVLVVETGGTPAERRYTLDAHGEKVSTAPGVVRYKCPHCPYRAEKREGHDGCQPRTEAA